MAFNPTSQQKLALETSGSNILVSAGAGSGKTRVLTERILNYVRNGVDIDHLLVLTFTKNAAENMKSRIRQGLIDDPTLKEQLLKVESAPITNFDSFSLSFVKKYYYLLNIDKNINIGDQSFFLKKSRDFLRDILKEYYDNNDKDLYSILKSNGESDDNYLFDSIINMYNKLSLKSNFKEFLVKLKEDNYMIKSDEKLYEDYMQTVLMSIHKVRDYYNDIGDLNTYLSKNKIEELFEFTEYDDIKAYFDKYPSFPRKPNKFIYGEEHDDIKKLYKKIPESLKYEDKEALINELTYSRKHADFFVNILLRLDDMLQEYKKSINTFEFIDIAKMAIRILKENPLIREDNINKYHEILVDEYQDTSDIQEEFINLLSKDNVYMVGDIKQSIYRFRNANCDIFKQKYLDYEKSNGGIKIDMTINFRSRSGVISTINNMFDILMNLEYGGADYIKSHHMSAGNKEFDNQGKLDVDDSIVILNYDEDDVDEKYHNMAYEALIIANDIKNKIESGYKVYDEKDGLRNATFKDFAIISSTNTHFSLFKEVFDSLNIPLQVYQNESVTSSMFLNVIKNLLILYKTIYNHEINTVDFKHAFMSVARSVLFSYSDQEIFDIIVNNKYYDSDIYKIMNNIVYKYSNNSNINIFNKIIEDFDVYNLITRDYGVADANTTIEYIIKKILSLESAHISFIDFVDYLSCLIDEDYKMEYEGVLEESNSVTLMNIHKSKGLEYRIIYFYDLNHKFNLQDLKQHYNFDDNYGFMINNNGESPLRSISNYFQRKEEISEKIRLFYVALTRAKESMIFVTCSSFEKENISEKINDIRFNEFLTRLSIYFNNIACIKNVVCEYPADFLSNSMKETDVSSFLLTKKDISVDYEIIEKGHASNVIKEIIDINTYKILKEGTRFHEILESLDLKNPDFSNIDDYHTNKIKSFLSKISLEDCEIYQEHEFFTTINGQEIHGIIDLLLEYKDNIYIIDYKLSNADENKYKNQLRTYKTYVESVSCKKCKTFLYSLLKEDLLEVVL